MSLTMHWQKVEFVQSVAQMEQFPNQNLPCIGVAGHSNVGKSSLLNSLFQRKKMVKVAKAPGCTRLLNLFRVDERLLVTDLPGYGYARVAKSQRKQWANLVDQFFSSRTAMLILVLLDVRHGPKDSDLQLIEFLNEVGVRWIPIATKTDKLGTNQLAKRLKEMQEDLGGYLKPIPTSSHNKKGMDILRETIIHECFVKPYAEEL
ncbi:MAG: ribosome biogenesis GTP-binding protein YihA/YsxC [Mariprofundaceae bacterium]|nr:ribosome biogenesis GTP-binding protein YihA/YsxC [Mariprofundaceae bacterium]